MLKFIFTHSAGIDEGIYLICGLICIVAAVYALRHNESARTTTFLFWLIVGVLFGGGKWLMDAWEYGAALIGALLLFLGVLTLTGRVKMGNFKPRPANEERRNADRIGYKIFIPALVLAISAFALSQASQLKIPMGVDEKGVERIFSFTTAQALGFSSLLGILSAWVVARPKVDETAEDMARIVMQVGPSSLLPQLLAGLGVIFAAAGVGEIIGAAAGNLVPEGSRLAGAIAYVLGMMLFTMIMGNAFAAFTVMTLGIGIPFLIAPGGNPAVIGALGMTAGYCGTLLTPMAANFNMVPASVLEMKDKYGVIKAQIPVALIMAVFHVVLILLIGF